MATNAPKIVLRSEDDTAAAAAWNAGTIKAGTISSTNTIHVWNGYGDVAGTDPECADMIEATVTTLTESGTDGSEGGTDPAAYEHITGHWIEVNVNDKAYSASDAANDSNIKPSDDNLEWYPIGGSQTANVRGLGLATRSDNTTAVNTATGADKDTNHDPVEDDVLKYVAQNNNLASVTGTDAAASVAKLTFRVNVASSAAPGTHKYKIRIQGYYL